MPSSPASAPNATRAEVQAALDALTEGAKGNANLLDLAVKAARKMATVGEISYALEKVFTRHKAEIRAISGVYKKEAAMNPSVDRVKTLVEAFDKNDGRRPRILIAKLGQDGHDRGQKVIASAFADLGFDVDIGPLFATADEAARQAVENDVHVVGVSSMTAGHLTLVPELKAALDKEGRGDIMIVVGGVIPPHDYDDALRRRRQGRVRPRHQHPRSRSGPRREAECAVGVWGQAGGGVTLRLSRNSGRTTGVILGLVPRTHRAASAGKSG